MKELKTLYEIVTEYAEEDEYIRSEFWRNDLLFSILSRALDDYMVTVLDAIAHRANKGDMQ